MDQGIIVDLETSGLDPSKDHILEVGLIRFSWNGKDLPVILEAYSALQDPGIVLDPEIIKLTGITNEALVGQKINWSFVAQLLSNSGLVIAHNADFDASFLLKVPELVDLDCHFACSMKHIDWAGKGYRSQALNYLAADHGFVNPFAHRALFDCATTFKIIGPYLAELVQKSFESEFLLSAWNAPFSMKDELRLKGYRWDSEKRVWSKFIFENTREDEISFLNERIYSSDNGPWTCDPIPHIMQRARA